MISNNPASAKRKVFFLLSCLGSGGSERVFWNVSQGLNKSMFDVAIVILNSRVSCYSMDLENVRIIDLNTLKASKSFYALYKLLKKEKPDVVFSTTDHINMLVSIVARFFRSTDFIARISNIPSEQKLYDDNKAKFYSLFAKLSYKVFDRIICQTEAMQQAVQNDYSIDEDKTMVIPNPVIKGDWIKTAHNSSKQFRLLLVARFAPEKGLDRLIDIFSTLPSNYHLSMVGKGRLKDEIIKKVENLGLNNRVSFLGEIKNVQEVMTQHDLLVLSSYTEGCPNVVIEALSVGLPVVGFHVSGMKELIIEGFNGFVIQQNDLFGFKEKIIQACESTVWNYKEIKTDVYTKFDLKRVSKAYEELIN